MVLVPASVSAIATGTLLGLARIARETAPLLFTSFNNQYWSEGLNQPAASSPVMIYKYAKSKYDNWHHQVWAAGFILLMLVRVVNIGARLILYKGRGRGGGDNMENITASEVIAGVRGYEGQSGILKNIMVDQN